MTLQKLVADFGDRALAHATASALQDFAEPAPDALTVFENGPGHWRLEAFFNDWTGGRDIAAELAPVIDGPLPEFVLEDVPDLNWVAISQAALPPVEAGRFVVHGSHARGCVARGPTKILIDAGEAFGTAEGQDARSRRRGGASSECDRVGERQLGACAAVADAQRLPR